MPRDLGSLGNSIAAEQGLETPSCWPTRPIVASSVLGCRNGRSGDDGGAGRRCTGDQPLQCVCIDGGADRGGDGAVYRIEVGHGLTRFNRNRVRYVNHVFVPHLEIRGQEITGRLLGIVSATF